MKKTLKSIFAILAVIFILAALTVPAFADEVQSTEAAAVSETAEETEEATESDSTNAKAVSAAVVVGIVAAAGAASMAIAIKSASEGMARQPEVAGSIRSSMMLGLVFIETAIIYALIVAILLIFVL
jgi:F-type H+-transporting ATPase subunit c